MISTLTSFDVVVIGGGHAGCEAASWARTGATPPRPRIVVTSARCLGPAIGGLAKATGSVRSMRSTA